MNDESPASNFNLPSSSNHSSNHVSTPHISQDTQTASITSNRDLEQKAKEIQKIYKIQYLDHLIRSLDIMTYAELSLIYYMDCSFFAFAVRALNQWLYFTPKPAVFPPLITWDRIHIFVIFVLNLLWILVHLSATPPTAGEAVRGYLHGGLLIDFVGEKSPVSRVRLAVNDCLVLALQLVLLGVAIEKKKLDAPQSRGEDGEEPAQDHDAEERGTRRSQENSDAIELQLLPCTFGDGIGVDTQRHGLLRRDEPTPTDHPGDAFYSGQYCVANVNPC